MAIDVGGSVLTLRTDRGVFSHGRVDPGTAVLLRTAPSSTARRHVPRSRLRQRRAGPGACPTGAAGNGVGGRRQRAGASIDRRERRRQRIAQRRRSPIPRVFQPTCGLISSGRTRRSASASRHCTTCCLNVAPATLVRGPGGARRPEAPRRRLAAALAHRRGLADHTPRLLSGLPHAAGPLEHRALAARRIDLDADAAALRARRSDQRLAEARPRLQPRAGRRRRGPDAVADRRRRRRCAATRRRRRWPGPLSAASAANGGSDSSRRRSVSGPVSLPGSASTAACTTSWWGRNVCTQQPPAARRGRRSAGPRATSSAIACSAAR